MLPSNAIALAGKEYCDFLKEIYRDCALSTRNFPIRRQMKRKWYPEPSLEIKDLLLWTEPRTEEKTCCIMNIEGDRCQAEHINIRLNEILQRLALFNECFVIPHPKGSHKYICVYHWRQIRFSRPGKLWIQNGEPKPVDEMELLLMQLDADQDEELQKAKIDPLDVSISDSSDGDTTDNSEQETTDSSESESEEENKIFPSEISDLSSNTDSDVDSSDEEEEEEDFDPFKEDEVSDIDWTKDIEIEGKDFERVAELLLNWRRIINLNSDYNGGTDMSSGEEVETKDKAVPLDFMVINKGKGKKKKKQKYRVPHEDDLPDIDVPEYEIQESESLSESSKTSDVTSEEIEETSDNQEETENDSTECSSEEDISDDERLEMEVDEEIKLDQIDLPMEEGKEEPTPKNIATAEQKEEEIEAQVVARIGELMGTVTVEDREIKIEEGVMDKEIKQEDEDEVTSDRLENEQEDEDGDEEDISGDADDEESDEEEVEGESETDGSEKSDAIGVDEEESEGSFDDEEENDSEEESEESEEEVEVPQEEGNVEERANVEKVEDGETVRDAALLEEKMEIDEEENENQEIDRATDDEDAEDEEEEDESEEGETEADSSDENVEKESEAEVKLELESDPEGDEMAEFGERMKIEGNASSSEEESDEDEEQENSSYDSDLYSSSDTDSTSSSISEEETSSSDTSDSSSSEDSDWYSSDSELEDNIRNYVRRPGYLSEEPPGFGTIVTLEQKMDENEIVTSENDSTRGGFDGVESSSLSSDESEPPDEPIFGEFREGEILLNPEHGVEVAEIIANLSIHRLRRFIQEHNLPAPRSTSKLPMIRDIMNYYETGSSEAVAAVMDLIREWEDDPKQKLKKRL